MATRTPIVGSGLLLAVTLSGCPVTDDYYLLPEGSGGGSAGSAVNGGTGATAGTETINPGGGSGAAGAGGSAVGAQPGGGSDGGGSDGTSGAPAGGEASGGEAGAGGTTECMASPERCNGRDDDCDGEVDDGVCPAACVGFVIEAGATEGYMYCTSREDFSHAREACGTQAMRLVWLQSMTENQAVSEQLRALGDDTEVLIAATDQAREGDWVWYGGPLFWKGNQNGNPVNGAFVAWAPGVPDSFGGNEDCAILNPMLERWSDRSCSADFAYLCEDVPPAR
jgi:hypothetical protein